MPLASSSADSSWRYLSWIPNCWMGLALFRYAKSYHITLIISYYMHLTDIYVWDSMNGKHLFSFCKLHRKVLNPQIPSFKLYFKVSSFSDQKKNWSFCFIVFGESGVPARWKLVIKCDSHYTLLSSY